MVTWNCPPPCEALNTRAAPDRSSIPSAPAARASPAPVVKTPEAVAVPDRLNPAWVALADRAAGADAPSDWPDPSNPDNINREIAAAASSPVALRIDKDVGDFCAASDDERVCKRA